MFKSATLALAAIAASASIASADINDLSNFAMEQDSAGRVELGLVRATGDGVVEVYTFHGGEIGALLGSEMVHAGANRDVDVNIRRTGLNAIALLKVGGQIVDTQEIDFK